jgi:hypothetical protein
MPTFERQSKAGTDRIAFEPAALIMAGWTGRDRAAVDHHIAELAALGVPGPSRIPTFYRLDPALLAGPVPAIHVLGEDTSGEVEAVLLALADGLWVGLGSDHTDRKMEAHGVAISKQLCRKPMAAGLWRFDELTPHWDRLILRAHIIEGERTDEHGARTIEAGARTLYMEAPLAAVRRPDDLIRAYAAELGQSGERALPVGTVMFMGAIGAIGGVRPARRFEMTLEDPVLGRTLSHAYDVRALPIVT